MFLSRLFLSKKSTVPTRLVSLRFNHTTRVCDGPRLLNTRRSAASIPSPGNRSPDDSHTVLPDAVIEPDGTVTSKIDGDERKQLWKHAIKAPMYSVGIMPILVSGMAAYMKTGSASPMHTLCLCISAVLIIGWLNLSNDFFDSFTGVDDQKHESVVRLTGNRTAVFLVANAFLLAGAGFLFSLLQSADPLVSKMVYAAICMGYLYQGPPFRWSYLGLGEPLCFMAFGPLATTAFYVAQLPSEVTALASINPTIITLSILVGISTTVILFCSHFHQIDGDRKAGKKSPLVRMGLSKSAVALKVAVGATYMLTLLTSLFGILPFGCWTSAMVAYPIAGDMVKMAEEGAASDDGGKSLSSLKMVATKWHIAFQSCIILGFIIQKLMLL